MVKFFKHIYKSIHIVSPILSPHEIINYTYRLIFILFTGKILNSHNISLRDNSNFINSWAAFFEYNTNLLKHIISSLIANNNNWYIRLFFNIINVTEVQKTWDNIIIRLFSFRKQGREQWEKKYIPLFIQMNPLFHNVIQFAPSIHKIINLWKQSIKWIKLQPLNIVLPNATNSTMKAIYWNIFNISEWERITPTVRKSMNVLEIVKRTEPAHIIYNDCIIWKFIEDGFNLANKRSVINTVLTNIGIPFGWNSTLLSHIIQLADAKENSFNIMANSQGWQRDLTIFRICGWIDPLTLKLYSVLAFELCDSSYQQKKVGAPGARSNFKYINQYASKVFFCKEWKNYRV